MFKELCINICGTSNGTNTIWYLWYLRDTLTHRNISTSSKKNTSTEEQHSPAPLRRPMGQFFSSLFQLIVKKSYKLKRTHFREASSAYFYLLLLHNEKKLLPPSRFLRPADRFSRTKAPSFLHQSVQAFFAMPACSQWISCMHQPVSLPCMHAYACPISSPEMSQINRKTQQL